MLQLWKTHTVQHFIGFIYNYHYVICIVIINNNWQLIYLLDLLLFIIPCSGPCLFPTFLKSLTYLTLHILHLSLCKMPYIVYTSHLVELLLFILLSPHYCKFRLYTLCLTLPIPYLSKPLTDTYLYLAIPHFRSTDCTNKFKILLKEHPWLILGLEPD